MLELQDVLFKHADGTAPYGVVLPGAVLGLRHRKLRGLYTWMRAQLGEISMGGAISAPNASADLDDLRSALRFATILLESAKNVHARARVKALTEIVTALQFACAARDHEENSLAAKIWRDRAGLLCHLA